MSTLMKRSIIFVIITDFAFVSTSLQDGTGQKAHFSLKDTPGSFSVHATKTMAKVSSKADSVKVVVKPGMAEVPLPVMPTQQPLVHVMSPAIVRPAGGWNFMSLGKKKRSQIENKNSLRKSVGNPNGNEKYFRRKSFVKPGQKREFIERKMDVKRGRGKFSVHVDQKQANISSSTGGLQVFIKNPSMSQLPREMLQLPGVALQLPSGMSQLPGPMSQLTKGTAQKPSLLVKLPYDWTGASNWDDD